MEIIYLMKRNIKIARLDFEGKILRRFEVYIEKQLPIGFKNPMLPFEKSFKNVITSLDNWLQTRKIPNPRPGYAEIKSKLKLYDTTKAMLDNYGLSLNDSYWFKKESDNIKWEDINFYTNTYSRELGDILLNPKGLSNSLNLISPDFTTNGEDIKRWCQINNESYLVKTNHTNEQVACNEVFASNLCYLLNIPHIEYKLIRQNINIYKGQEKGFKSNIDIYENKECLFSICKNYCNESYSYVSAQTYIHTLKPATNETLYKEINSNKKLKEKLENIIIIDYLIENIDRHLNNYGFIIDDYNNIVDMFPVFDCGNSMNYLDRFHTDTNDYSQMFQKKFEELLDLVSNFKRFNLDRIKNIDDMFYKIYNQCNISNKEKDSILRLYKWRILQLEEYIKKRA